MYQLEHTESSLDTKRTAYMGGTNAELYRSMTISFTTAADSKTSRRCSERWYGKPQAGMQADDNKHRFQSCFEWRTVTKQC
jgi:hypothetical protein